MELEQVEGHHRHFISSRAGPIPMAGWGENLLGVFDDCRECCCIETKTSQSREKKSVHSPISLPPDILFLIHLNLHSIPASSTYPAYSLYPLESTGIPAILPATFCLAITYVALIGQLLM
mgnify:CR=1 FL=1